MVWPPGWDVRYIDQTGSTNDDLLRAAGAGRVGDRAVLMAGHQTAGRGRLGRRWDAPPGANLLASVYLDHGDDEPAVVVQRVGLALLAGIDEVLGGQRGPRRRAGLKWPNDVLVDGRKVAGVLAQRASDVTGIVVGFGVNVGWAPDGGARLAADHDRDEHSCAALLARVLAAFDRRPRDVSDAYAQRLVTIGQQVRVELPGDAVLVGRAIAVEPSGRLVVVDGDDVAHRLDVGDVVHLRPDE